MTRSNSPTTDGLGRRRFVALGAGAGAALLAGCSSGTSPDGTDGDDGGTPGSTNQTTAVGTFRLLVSDRPSAIGDFDSLVVTLDTARVFGPTGDGGTDETGTATSTGTANETSNATSTGTDTATATGTATESPNDDSTEDDADGGQDAEGDDGGGFSVLDLDGATVDLTEVVGEKATPVFEGDLPEGRYTKVELHASAVDGVVDGGSVDVKLPSEKLQITRNFEVRAGESLSFVFDVTVVEKGQGGYNLLPVISESGVAGEDVEVEEVGAGGRTSTGSGTSGGDDDATPNEDAGPPAGSPGYP